MKTETVHSRADWEFHENRYDDVIDAEGRLVVTVSVMDIAVVEMLQESYCEGGVAKELFALEADGCWSIYLAVSWLTPARVQSALERLGNLLGRTFLFDPYHLPRRLEARYRRQARAMLKNAGHTVPAAEVLAKPQSGTAREPKHRRPGARRLTALTTQRLKA